MTSIFRSGAFRMRLVSVGRLSASPFVEGERNGGDGFSMVAKEGRQTSPYPLC